MEEIHDFVVRFLHYQEIYYVKKWRRWLLNFSTPTEVQYAIYQCAPHASTIKDSVFSIRVVYTFRTILGTVIIFLNNKD